MYRTDGVLVCSSQPRPQAPVQAPPLGSSLCTYTATGGFFCDSTASQYAAESFADCGAYVPPSDAGFEVGFTDAKDSVMAFRLSPSPNKPAHGRWILPDNVEGIRVRDKISTITIIDTVPDQASGTFKWKTFDSDAITKEQQQARQTALDAKAASGSSKAKKAPPAKQRKLNIAMAAEGFVTTSHFAGQLVNPDRYLLIVSGPGGSSWHNCFVSNVLDAMKKVANPTSASIIAALNDKASGAVAASAPFERLLKDGLPIDAGLEVPVPDSYNEIVTTGTYADAKNCKQVIKMEGNRKALMYEGDIQDVKRCDGLYLKYGNVFYFGWVKYQPNHGNVLKLYHSMVGAMMIRYPNGQSGTYKVLDHGTGGKADGGEGRAVKFRVTPPPGSAASVGATVKWGDKFQLLTADGKYKLVSCPYPRYMIDGSKPQKNNLSAFARNDKIIGYRNADGEAGYGKTTGEKYSNSAIQRFDIKTSKLFLYEASYQINPQYESDVFTLRNLTPTPARAAKPGCSCDDIGKREMVFGKDSADDTPLGNGKCRPSDLPKNALGRDGEPVQLESSMIYVGSTPRIHSVSVYGWTGKSMCPGTGRLGDSRVSVPLYDTFDTKDGIGRAVLPFMNVVAESTQWYGDRGGLSREQNMTQLKNSYEFYTMEVISDQ